MGISDYFYYRMINGVKKVRDSGDVGVPCTTDLIKADENAELNFIVLGDPQVSAFSPIRGARLFSACRDISNMKGRLDALIAVGDLTEFGFMCEYRFTSYLFSLIGDKYDRFLCMPGNHDVRLRGYNRQLHIFRDFIRSVKETDELREGCYSYSCFINGYKFIIMGTDFSTFEGAYISDKQLRWLECEIKSAQDGKPIFIFNHQTLRHTNGLPKTFIGNGKWRGSIGMQSDKVRAVFEKYNNIVFITGHLHYSTCEYTFEDCGSFKAISVPTVGVNNHGKFDKEGQSFVFSVYKDRIVARSRLFTQGKYVGNSVKNGIIEIELPSGIHN